MAEASLRDEIRAFVAERDWSQFHSPENLAKSITIEAGELLECFQWSPDADASRVQEELADVLTYCLMLAERIGVVTEQNVRVKIAALRSKYQEDKVRCKSTTYDQP